MGKGKKHESAAQERQNLLGINPIPDHASGSWMSKHSIAGRGSTSPLHDEGHGGAPGHTHENDNILDKGINSFKKWANQYDWSLRSSAQGGRSLVAPTSQGGSAGFSGDTYGSDIKKSMKWFRDKLSPSKPSANTPKKKNRGGA